MVASCLTCVRVTTIEKKGAKNVKVNEIKSEARQKYFFLIKMRDRRTEAHCPVHLHLLNNQIADILYQRPPR